MDLGLSSFGSLLNCSSGCSLQVLATLRAFRCHPAAFELYIFNQQELFYIESRLGDLLTTRLLWPFDVFCDCGVLYWPRNDEPRLLYRHCETVGVVCMGKGC